MTPEQLAARWLADVRRHYDDNAERVILEADALAAIARHLAPGDDLVERLLDTNAEFFLPVLEEAAVRLSALTAQVADNQISEPHDPGDFVGDIYYGHPIKTTMGTHRWTGTEWVALPSEAEALAGLLAEARNEAATLRARLARMEGALRFYADPETYHGIMVLGDRPCGEFASDISDVEHEFYENSYGAKARAALTDGGSNG